jgi:thymidine phosphorylase
VIEAIETLKGRGPDDFRELCLLLSSHLLSVAGLASSLEAARQRVDQAVASGAALTRFRQLIEHQGGDAAIVDDYSRFPQAMRVERVVSAEAGYVGALRADVIGRASMLLGAGREEVGDTIDYGAGILLRAKPGDRVAVGGSLADLHVGAHARADEARELAGSAFSIVPTPPPPSPLLLDVAA